MDGGRPCPPQSSPTLARLSCRSRPSVPQFVGGMRQRSVSGARPGARTEGSSCEQNLPRALGGQQRACRSLMTSTSSGWRVTVAMGVCTWRGWGRGWG